MRIRQGRSAPPRKISLRKSCMISAATTYGDDRAILDAYAAEIAAAAKTQTIAPLGAQASSHSDEDPSA